VPALRRPPLILVTILSWADAHLDRTGRWPSCADGQVHGAPGEAKVNLNHALSRGQRGLPGGDTLARLLARERGRRLTHRLLAIHEDQIVAWAKARHPRTGRWPTANSVTGTHEGT
jgi:hypothetical protein